LSFQIDILVVNPKIQSNYAYNKKETEMVTKKPSIIKGNQVSCLWFFLQKDALVVRAEKQSYVHCIVG